MSITSKDISNEINLNVEWEISNDPDFDELQYGFVLHEIGHFRNTSMVIMDSIMSENQFNIPCELITELILQFGCNVISGGWTVFVKDGIDTVQSSNVRNITLDGSDV